MTKRNDQSVPGEAGVGLQLVPPPRSEIAPFELQPSDAPALIGRSSRCRVSLRSPRGDDDDLLLSREHAVIEHRGGRWFARDVSRHGTFLNGVRLQPGDGAALRPGDQLRLGGWVFDILIGGEGTRQSGTSVATVERSADASRMRRFRGDEVGNLAQHRLDILLDCAERTADLNDEAALPPVILEAAMRGTGLARAGLLRPSAAPQEMTILAERNLGMRPTISRSLVQAAMDGDVAVLTPETRAQFGASIVELDIRQAVCAPIVIDGAVDSLLYLDSRSGDSPAEPDVAAFCHGLCRIAGLARANVQRQRMRREHEIIDRELKAAQIIQERLLPGTEGVVGGVCYAMRLEPGRQIAGDLFDVIRVSDSITAVCLGDVAGGGAGPGLVMAMTLAHLRASLEASDNLERTIESLNQYLCERTPANVFVSLWLGALDHERGICRWVDAGHGHWIHWRKGAALPRRREAGAMPLGIDDSTRYAAAEVALAPGDRLVLYSDGVSECRRRGDGTIELFGRHRVEAALTGSSSPVEDVKRIFSAIHEFCGEQGLADDTTAASVALAP